MRSAIIFSILSLGFSTLISAEFATPSTDSQAFRSAWYDRGAEISRYTIEQMRYGKARTGEAVLIYVTEPIDTVQHVKSDNPRAATSTPGFKLNRQTWFRTGIYPMPP